MVEASPPAPAPAQFREFQYVSSDGLRLVARDYGDPSAPWLPVVCLPGLTRSVRDYHALALYLSRHRQRPRRVVAFDYRGRGRSDWDKDPAKYAIGVEAGDVLDGMAAMGIPRAVVVGTSRGGIIGMVMAFTRPQTVAALVLNDIGPLIEPKGLVRLKSYVGRTPKADDWTDAVRIQRRLHGSQFTAFDEADWEQFARQTYRDDNGRPDSDYDPRLALTLAGNVDQPSPGLWDEFQALRPIPVLAIRGANSDILSAATLARMESEHPRLETVIVPDEGHPPQLRLGPLLARIASFVAATEDGPVPAAPLPAASAD